MPRQGWQPNVAKGSPPDSRLYTLGVFLISGQVTEAFVKKNPVISRTIQIRGDQTLEDLHDTILRAFGRWDEHSYEFQFGRGPHDPNGTRYVVRGAAKPSSGRSPKIAGLVGLTTIGSLGLTVGQAFGYWFDFGDDWWHQIDVVSVVDEAPKGKYPKVTKRVGKSPPQYADLEEDGAGDDEEEEKAVRARVRSERKPKLRGSVPARTPARNQAART